MVLNSKNQIEFEHFSLVSVFIRHNQLLRTSGSDYISRSLNFLPWSISLHLVLTINLFTQSCPTFCCFHGILSFCPQFLAPWTGEWGHRDPMLPCLDPPDHLCMANMWLLKLQMQIALAHPLYSNHIYAIFHRKDKKCHNWKCGSKLASTWRERTSLYSEGTWLMISSKVSVCFYFNLELVPFKLLTTNL